MSDSPEKKDNLLIELGTEELPPKALKNLAQSFSSSIAASLTDAGLASIDEHDARFFAAPRRLAVWVRAVASGQPDRLEQRRGPSVSAAFDANKAPTKAALGFARSCGVEVSELATEETEKGSWLTFQHQVKGQAIDQIVNTALETAIKQLPIPKRMRWGDSAQEFVRPVHWLLALYGETTLNVSVLGLQSGNSTRGHRFHCPTNIPIPSADQYVQILRDQGHVQVDYAERQKNISAQVAALESEAGGNAVLDQALLDEVTGLVEWPVSIRGKFDEKFLDIPAEVLVSSMRDHQKYFHLVDDSERLLPGFITVSNIESNDPHRVRAGNERVLRARLSDAEFFWQADQKINLESRIPSLREVLFHKKLGSVHDKVQRMKLLAQIIAETIDADEAFVDRACDLCKVDLVTDMVGEFPELQGTIGRYYATNQGEPGEVSTAIEEHYRPRFAGDVLPGNPVSQCLALADRLDSLAGIFTCGEIPTGDKDPYGLRRASLGVLRIIIDSKLNLDLYALIQKAVIGFSDTRLELQPDTADKVFSFVTERLRAYYQPLGFDTEEVNAVMAVKPKKPFDFDQRIRALHDFVKNHQDDALSLAAANKRIANLLNKQSDAIAKTVDPALFREKAESDLFELVSRTSGSVKQAFSCGNYSEGLTQLSALKGPVDQFFDDVMVMDEDQSIRSNRLALLQTIRLLFLEVADISVIRVE
ncbi:MAG: glycine--tRNA ligase subunit beta [Acidiferrobacterales bacterium]|nr:glycine--tRNA ligase subunit beta [Acidiferrobacterales bacterium]